MQYPAVSVRTVHNECPGDSTGKLCILLSLFLPHDDPVKGKVFPEMHTENKQERKTWNTWRSAAVEARDRRGERCVVCQWVTVWGV